MTQLNSFHEVRFPTDLALGSTGGPERRTEIVTLGSGREQRNTRWAHSRRRYNAGYGIKTINDLHSVIEFFEERRGRLYGFRFRDPVDWKSCSPGQTITATDQVLGVGDGVLTEFQMKKNYGSQDTGYFRPIVKPVESTLTVAIDNTVIDASDYSLDPKTGLVTFTEIAVPASGLVITCGFEFDVPVRFDTDEIAINLSHFQAGDIPSIPLMELLA